MTVTDLPAVRTRPGSLTTTGALAPWCISRRWTRLVGLLALTSAAGVGVLLRGVVGHDGLTSYDPSITHLLVNSRTPGWTAIAQVVTTVGSDVSMFILAGLACVWLLVVRSDRRAAVLLASSMLAVAVLVLGIKALVARPRPAAWMVSGPPETSYSFPSGHTLASTVCLGVAAGLLARRARPAGRLVLLLLWLLGSGAVGFTRVYLGYHWLTDVLAGLLLGVVVLSLGIVAMLRTTPPAALERVTLAQT